MSSRHRPNFQQHVITLPSRVVIHLLGVFRLQVDQQFLPIAVNGKIARILMQLSLAGERCLPRERILEDLWPRTHTAKAGQSLNSTIYHLHKLVGNNLCIVYCEGGMYCLNVGEDIAIDVDYFIAWQKKGRALLTEGKEAEGVSLCKQALALYRNDLWIDDTIRALIERERLRILYLNLLATLADYYFSRGRFAQALDEVHRILLKDPCREDAHRMAMRCYMEMGLRSLALKQFQLCSTILAREFDARPEPVSKELYDQIRKSLYQIGSIAQGDLMGRST